MIAEKSIVEKVMKKYGLKDNGKGYSTIRIAGKEVREDAVKIEFSNEDNVFDCSFCANDKLSCINRTISYPEYNNKDSVSLCKEIIA